MPLINVKLIEDVFTPEQKRRIVEELTDAMVAIEGENMRSVTWCVIGGVQRRLVRGRSVPEDRGRPAARGRQDAAACLIC